MIPRKEGVLLGLILISLGVWWAMLPRSHGPHHGGDPVTRFVTSGGDADVAPVRNRSFVVSVPRGPMGSSRAALEAAFDRCKLKDVRYTERRTFAVARLNIDASPDQLAGILGRNGLRPADVQELMAFIGKHGSKALPKGEHEVALLFAAAEIYSFDGVPAVMHGYISRIADTKALWRCNPGYYINWQGIDFSRSNDFRYLLVTSAP